MPDPTTTGWRRGCARHKEYARQRDPEAKNVLRETYAKAKLPAEIEIYAGAAHGWCPPDSAVYNEKQAERAWARLLVLFKTALA